MFSISKLCFDILELEAASFSRFDWLECEWHIVNNLQKTFGRRPCLHLGGLSLIFAELGLLKGPSDL